MAGNCHQPLLPQCRLGNHASEFDLRGAAFRSRHKLNGACKFLVLFLQVGETLPRRARPRVTGNHLPSSQHHFSMTRGQVGEAQVYASHSVSSTMRFV